MMVYTKLIDFEFTYQNKTQSQELLEIIYTYICGSPHVYYFIERYFIAFIVDILKYNYIYNSCKILYY